MYNLLSPFHVLPWDNEIKDSVDFPMITGFLANTQITCNLELGHAENPIKLL